MLSLSLCGAYQESVFLILQDAIQRITILQHLSPQYFCDNGTLINGVTLPKLHSERSLSKKTSKAKPEKDKLCSTLSSSTVEGATYGNCGRFERRMCQILDTIELARAEITGTQAVKLSNGRIQYINEKQIRERKSKEDLQTVSGCLEQILREIKDKGTFRVLASYVGEKTDAFTKMVLLSSSDRESARIISEMNLKVDNSKVDFDEREKEFKTTIRHLRHQKQELCQKNRMQYNFCVGKAQSDIEELKMKFQSDENEILKECSSINQLIDREEKVNTKLSMYLRNNIQELEQSIEYWSALHAAEIHRFQTMLKNLTKEFNNLTTELETLAAKYVYYEKVCIEDRLQKAEQAKLDEIEAFHNNKVSIIQKWWRYICVMLSIGPHAPKKKSKKGKNKNKK